MRSILCAGLLAATVLTAGPVRSEGTDDTVTACDNLVTLRRLMMPEVAGDPDEPPPPPPDRTGCRDVPASAVGETERRTVIGGAPYECRSIDKGPCLWVRP